MTPLLVITDRHVTGGRPLRDVVLAALEGGARLIQLREKDLEGGALFTLATELAALVHRFEARLLVNDRIDVALAAAADGVVLPADSFPTEVARRLLGRDRLIARSTHTAVEVERAADDGCDFALFGPVHVTPSKTAYGAPQGIEALRTGARAPLPVYAVGGLTVANGQEAIAAGAAGIAVIRAVMSADDPARAVRDLLEELSHPR